MLREVLAELREKTGAAAAFVLDKDGQLVEGAGTDGLGPQPLVDWVAGSSEGLVLAEQEFTILRQDPAPQPRGVHCRQTDAAHLLVVVFDTTVTRLGLVRHHSAEAARRMAAFTS
ncbi:MAG: hypothetical protein HY317_04805 [Acidobacteria bacterium]|nr:hypothetical protein [Acidobacteriota bacterium]